MGPTEAAIVLALFVLLFGYKRLPNLGRNLGEAYRELRSETDD
ncbi:twin-arginine translocase TatA/TatE family subunit [Halomicroarcula sp. S1AR25-4]|nr:twin-arginine translocase TatA/TatE family subunit [Halomicroarcula sp. S1AR25-4]MDS0279995.1 twin-arginine translocase TatA/TatE family subunit [Halomicroarcula sp. S1AR25-4]